MSKGRAFVKVGRNWKYVPPLHPFDVAANEAYPDYMSSGQEDTHLTIRRIMGFELHGHTETWSHSWIAEDEDFKVRGEWIDEVLERIFYLRAHRDEVKPWEHVSSAAKRKPEKTA